MQNRFSESSSRRSLSQVILAAVAVTFILLNPALLSQDDGSGSTVTIQYGDLVDKSALTHSGETVDEIIPKLPRYTDELKGAVQQYLEPFSILCHDVLLSEIGPDSLPLLNILARYPVGSEQPAWAALFREGHYQLYSNTNLIRLFVKGTDPTSSFEIHQSVVRHAIREVINSNHTSIEHVEIYAFENDYANTEIRLNTIPARFGVDSIDLSARRQPINLAGIEEFLDQGVSLKAVEVDESNDLYFYGKKAQPQTIAGYPISLSDIAVIYRSVFHYGYNAPYISLDNHEDNRYAKVNFGGHLENTRTGHVVLEADKLFKSLSTGLDPNTHELIKTTITEHVPDFLTEDERQLLEQGGMGRTRIRYWFYPDSIGTVTDGTVGAVLADQFLADAERMDVKVSLSKAVRETIDHLNDNFSQYENAENTFRELSNVGGIMALVIWLKEMNMNERVELDALLSVRLPAFTTPNKTKKMLAVTAMAYPDGVVLTDQSISGRTSVYYISHLLDQCSASTTDDEFLEVANVFTSGIDTYELAPSSYREMRADMDRYDSLIALSESEVQALDAEIDSIRNTLDRSDSDAVNRLNGLVDRFNSLIKSREPYLNARNELADRLNDAQLTRRSIASVGGGISLRPSDFKKVAHNASAPILKEIAEIKSRSEADEGHAAKGDWIRSGSGSGGPPPERSGHPEESSHGHGHSNEPDSLQALLQDSSSVTYSSDRRDWHMRISVNDYFDIIEFSIDANVLRVKHSAPAIDANGEISTDGRVIRFYKLH